MMIELSSGADARSTLNGASKNEPRPAGGVRNLIADVVGRDTELEAIRAFIDAVSEGTAALLLEGEAGIGKTTLWKAGIAVAEERGCRVLVARPVRAEAKLPFAALGDLFEEIPDDILDHLPEPQRDALDVALLRAKAGKRLPQRRAVAIAFLAVLRRIGEESPVVVAVDDLQWMDPSSAAAVQFALHRLGPEPIRLLASRRPEVEEEPFEITQAIEESRLRSVAIGPIDLDHLYLVLRRQLDLPFTRPLVKQILRISGGNPFFALEIARALVRRGGRAAPGEPLPVPRTLRDLVRERMAALPSSARHIAFVISALSAPTADVVEALDMPDGPSSIGLGQAIEARVVEVDGDRIRFTHPLLSSVLYSEATPAVRRHIHARLAALVRDPEERARHLALAAEAPDSKVAATLDEAAARSRARGAPEAAAELAEHACSLTPPEQSQALIERTLRAADYHFLGGNLDRAIALFGRVVESAPTGRLRAEALRRLGMTTAHRSWASVAGLYERALADAGEDTSLRAEIERDLGYAFLFTGDLRQAEAHAARALALHETIGDPASLAESLQAVAFIEFALGRGIAEDRIERAMALEDQTRHLDGILRPAYAFAQMLKYSDQLDAARSLFQEMLTQSIESGNDTSVPWLLDHLAELECRAGDLPAAHLHAQRAVEFSDQLGSASSPALFARALVEAHLGDVDAARLDAEQGYRQALDNGNVIYQIHNLSVLGFLELSTDDPSASSSHLERAIELATAMGVGEPGWFRLVPDAVEALVAVGELERAEAHLVPFEDQASALGRHWAAASAARCRALLLAGRGDLSAARERLESALHHHEALSEPFELGRTLLTLGAVLRRTKRRREGREVLERSLEIFERLGARTWSAKASRELGRIGGRAPRPWEFTPSELNVAELASMGRTNKEIAAALYLSPKTVEVNLGRIYRKLGVRSRTELARLASERGGFLKPSVPGGEKPLKQ